MRLRYKKKTLYLGEEWILSKLGDSHAHTTMNKYLRVMLPKSLTQELGWQGGEVVGSKIFDGGIYLKRID